MTFRDGHAPADRNPTVPTPNFDHVFVTLDSETLRRINECPFLADEQFGRFVRQQSESTLVGQYTPTRIAGQNTVVELFQDRIGGGEFAGVTAGLVLSFSNEGDAFVARQKLLEADIPFRGELIRRKVAGEEEPVAWYHSTRPDMTEGSPLCLFLSEVTADYYSRIGARNGGNGCYDRSAYLEAVFNKPYGGEHIMRDVVGVTIRLRPARVKRVSDVFEVLGYVKNISGDTVQLSGAEAEVTLLADESSIEGLLEVRMRMREPHPNLGRRFEFGSRSSLVLSPHGPNDNHAVWTFVPSKPVS